MTDMSTSGYEDASPGSAEVVGSVDDDGATRRYLIADITEDGAWIAMDADEAPVLSAWR